MVKHQTLGPFLAPLSASFPRWQLLFIIGTTIMAALVRQVDAVCVTPSHRHLREKRMSWSRAQRINRFDCLVLSADDRRVVLLFQVRTHRSETHKH